MRRKFITNSGQGLRADPVGVVAYRTIRIIVGRDIVDVIEDIWRTVGQIEGFVRQAIEVVDDRRDPLAA
jgi:hypothetical protein